MATLWPRPLGDELLSHFLQQRSVPYLAVQLLHCLHHEGSLGILWQAVAPQLQKAGGVLCSHLHAGSLRKTTGACWEQSVQNERRE